MVWVRWKMVHGDFRVRDVGDLFRQMYISSTGIMNNLVKTVDSDIPVWVPHFRQLAKVHEHGQNQQERLTYWS